MPFHTGEYDAYCILGDADAAPIWNWTQWSSLVPTLDPIVTAARDRAAIRSNQYLPDQQGMVKFGRIGWNENGHSKWAHNSPANSTESPHWSFLDVEMWAPSWTVCERENRAPDVFLQIGNEALSGGYNQQLSFNPVVIFAVSIDLSGNIADHMTTAVHALNETTRAKLCGFKRRPWGASRLGGFTNSIQDLCVSGLFKPGPRHAGNVDFTLLTDEWDHRVPEKAT